MTCRLLPSREITVAKAGLMMLNMAKMTVIPATSTPLGIEGRIWRNSFVMYAPGPAIR